MASVKTGAYYKNVFLMGEAKIDLAQLESKENKLETLYPLGKGYTIDGIDIEVVEESNADVKIAVGTIEEEDKFCIVPTNIKGNTGASIVTTINKTTNLTVYIKNGKPTKGTVIIRTRLIAPTIQLFEY